VLFRSISFAVPDYPRGKLYEAEVLDEQRKVVVWLSSVGSIDERGMAQIIIPHQLMRPGRYNLVVTCVDSGATAGQASYTFVIKP